MPYMIYQQYKTAIKEAYDGAPEVETLHVQAQAYRAWLASLRLEPRLLDPLVEPIAAIEEALKDLLPSPTQT
jgi:hypothetical protein